MWSYSEIESILLYYRGISFMNSMAGRKTANATEISGGNIQPSLKSQLYIFRGLLISKLHEMGMSYKLVKMVESIYQRTKAAVLTGEDRSDYLMWNRFACCHLYSSHYTVMSATIGYWRSHYRASEYYIIIVERGRCRYSRGGYSDTSNSDKEFGKIL